MPVEQAAGRGALAERLCEYGFDTCSIADRPPSELAADAVAELLPRCGLTDGGVDAVIYSTCSHRSEPIADRAVRVALDRLGLAGHTHAEFWESGGNRI